MKMNMQSWVESVLHSDKRLAIPLMTHPGIELTGRRISDAVQKGEFHYQAIKAIHDTFPTAVDVANIMMDLTVEAEAFGCKVKYSDDGAPTIVGRVVHDLESVKSLTVPDLQTGRLPEYIRASRLAVENLPDRPVFAGCIGPVSLAGRLYDMTEMMTALYAEPETMKILLQKCSVFLLEYVKEFKKVGANGIIMAEPSAGLLSANLCDEFSSFYIHDIVSRVQDDNFLFVLHNCGNTGHVTQSMISTGARGLHFGNNIDIMQVLREVPNNIIVMGNLDPVGIFKLSTSQEVFNTTLKLLRSTAGYRNFIISSGCDIPPGVPQENIRAFFKAVDFFNQTESPTKEF
jgi:uroporphyrinogen decarboxylase